MQIVQYLGLMRSNSFLWCVQKGEHIFGLKYAEDFEISEFSAICHYFLSNYFVF